MNRHTAHRVELFLCATLALAFSMAMISHRDSPGVSQPTAPQRSFTGKDLTTYTGARFTAYNRRVGPPLNSDVVFAVIRSGRLVPKVMGVTPALPAGPSAVEAMRDSKVELVVGSAYVETFYPPTPVGLLIVNNNTINPLNKQGMSIVLAVKNRKVNILSRDAFTARGVEGAFQVGPRLASAGSVAYKGALPFEPRIVNPEQQFAYKTQTETEPSSTRGFLGLRADGSIVVGVTLRGVRLPDLAEYLSAKIDAGGLGCSEAVNLCGGGSEVLSFRVGNEIKSFGNAKLRQAGLLTFVRP